MASFTPLPPMDGAALRTRAHGVRRDMVALLETVWRRKWIPVLCAAVGLGIGAAMMALTPPPYQATASIMLDARAAEGGALKSEAAIMESTPVLSKVAGTLRLYQDPAFVSRSWPDMIFNRDITEGTAHDRILARLDRIIDVRVLPGTSIIEMQARHSNPDRAAQIANALLAAYQERKVDERYEQSRRIANWMSDRLEDIRAEGQDAKDRLQAFYATHGSSVMQDPQSRSVRMRALASEMEAAQEDIAALTQRLEKAAQSGDAGRLTGLKKAEAQLQADIGQLAQRYGEKHPRMIAARAELAGVRKSIARASAGSMKSIEKDLSAARARVDALKTEIDSLTGGAVDDAQLRTQLHDLEAEIATNDRLYTDFLIKYQDAAAANDLRMADINVVSMATIPAHPDMGARLRVVGVLTALGFLGGLLFVLLRILWARGFTSADQLEGMTGYPVLAAIPFTKIKDEDGRPAGVHHNISEDPAAILAESLRSLRVSLRLRGELGHRPRVVALTSTLPDEGKTSLSVMLAMVAAKAGERVCVVDCDLRRPSLHKAFGIGNARGLADYLSDRLSADEVIHRKDPSGVHLVTAKAVPSYSLTLLTSGRMERLVESLREQYDLIILDAPSSLAFADARVLARMVDQSLYVVAWNRTRRDSVMASLKAYADMGYADMALILNKVDMREYLRDSAAAVVYQYGREQTEGALA